MNNECGVTQKNHSSGITYKCCLYKGHSGDHWELSKYGQVMQRWTNTAITYHYVGGRGYRKTAYMDESPLCSPENAKGFYEAPEVVLNLTLEELKGIVYALSGPEWLEDEPELVAKIDKALKEAL
jgi:hypothetical protein